MPERATTHPVGTKKPNAWGLHDMLGNVWEWVQDYDNEKIFADPLPPRRGKARVLKGGGFLADVKNAVYSTHAAGPGDGFDVGFRIVRDVHPPLPGAAWRLRHDSGRPREAPLQRGVRVADSDGS